MIAIANHLFSPIRYGYVTAKAGAIKSFLLKKAFFIDAISLRSVEGIYEMLKETAYKEYLNEEIVKKFGYSNGIEHIMWKRFFSIATKMEKNLKKEDKKMFSIFMAKYEIRNMKVIVGKALKKESFENELITKNQIELVEKIKKIENPIKAFYSTNFWNNLKENINGNELKKLKELEREMTIEKFFIALDFAYFNALKKLKGFKTYEYEMLQIDIYNIIKLLMAMKSENSEEKVREFLNDPYFIEGKITKNALLNAFKNNKIESLLSLYSLQKDDDITILEWKAKMTLFKRIKNYYIKAGFSLDKIMLLMLMLEREIILLRKIIIGKSFHESKDLLLKEIEWLYK
jgi:hypothetical protein